VRTNSPAGTLPRGHYFWCRACAFLTPHRLTARSRDFPHHARSLYTKKDIFLRELISNASDALDKIRFLSLSDPKLLEAKPELEIRVSTNKALNTLTIRDSGVGMNKQDLISNLGTVARSGTAAFMEQLSSGGDLNLIGQFGVGFYSIYLVADRVRVVSKKEGEKQFVWESSADGVYTVAEDPRGTTLGRGTEITLFLKEDASDFAKEDTVRGLLRKYSEFITFPIYLQTTKTETIEVPVPNEELAKDEAAPADGDEEVKAEDADKPKDEKPKTKTETKEVKAWEQVNEQKAIWSRGPESVTDEEYRAFFKAIVKDGSGDPLTWIHFKAEGEVEFRSILFIPSSPPPEMYDNYYGKSSALKLYVRKVLIADEFEDLVPRYLNFVRGVVDSDDLPLNVSREQLQQGKIIKVMSKKIVRKVLEMVKKMAQVQAQALKDKADENKTDAEKEAEAAKEAAGGSDDEDAEGGKSKRIEIPGHLKETAETVYDKFYEKFGKNIKLGVIEDQTNKSKLAKLLRFKSSKSKDGLRSFEQYIADMKAEQKAIYYIAGESVEQLEASPFMERLNDAGIEVLFMTDPIDEYAVNNLPSIEEHKLQSITKEGLVLPGDSGKDASRREKAYKETFAGLTTFLKTSLGSKVEKVAVSNRLGGSPAVLTTSQYGYSANMERIMKSQAFSDPSRAQFLVAKKTLEINPRHPFIVELAQRSADKPEDQETKDVAALLYDTALLNSGFALEDSKDFSARLFRLLKANLNLPSLDLAPEIALPPEEEVVEEEEGEEAAEDDSAGGDEL
jgi:heat shock protein beta